MKFTIERDCIAKILKRVDNVCTKSSSFTILESCMIDAKDGKIVVTGTDLEMILRVSSAADISEEGKVVVKCRRLYDTVMSLDSGTDITIFTDGNTVRVQAGTYKSAIPTSDITEYPPIESIKASDAVTTKASQFKELIDKIHFSISKDANRPEFTGALLSISENGVIQFVSTDGHRLSRIEDKVEINGTIADGFANGVIVPGKALSEISRTIVDGDIHLDLAQGKIVVKGDDVVFCSNLIAGSFPDFSKVIPPKLDHKAIVRCEDLQKLLRRAGIYSSKTCVVRLTLMAGGIEISAYDQNNGEMCCDVECEYDGSGVTAGFNWHYIDQILSAISCDVVSLEIIDMDSPAVIRDVLTDKIDYIVMPMQL